ncbi:MAG TPA: nucleotidyl transferase AbiEii/AbiGii toxin family protein [Catenuloplanes sp.]|jgi:hypothetical protein
MSPQYVGDFHRDIARVALGVARQHGFVLGGGVAWAVKGLVSRPTEDIDLFTDTDGAAASAAHLVRDALLAAGFEVDDEADDLGQLFPGFDADQREFTVARGEQAVRLSLCRLDRHRSPTVMDVGPVMHLDDLVATKVAALVNRREVRDYIDVAAALDRYTVAQMLDLARRHDPALEPDDIADAGRYLDRLDDHRFAYYGLSSDRVRDLRRRLAGWPRA